MAPIISLTLDLHKLLTTLRLLGQVRLDDVIQNLIEDTRELSEDTKVDLEAARKEIRAGRYYPLAEIKRQMSSGII
jgi:vacuolar-type H+-ATPase subunit C/Vma6